MADIKTVDLIIQAGGIWISADLDRDTTFPFNLSATELTNPTVTRVPFSSNIKLPATKTNDNIFSSIKQHQSVSVNIEPIRRTDFRLYINGTIFQTGYLQLLSTTKKQYEIRLFGGLGDYFLTASEKLLKNLDFGNDFNHPIDRSFVSQSFTSTDKTGIHSYFGYVMTYQGQYDNFDSDYYANSNNMSGPIDWSSTKSNKTYEKLDLNEHYRQGFLGEDRENPDTKEPFFGEYRSYYQKPWVKVSKIFEKITGNTETGSEGVIDGWTTELDPTFFNEDNPYWNDLWCILPNYNTEEDQLGTRYTPETGTNGWIDEKYTLGNIPSDAVENLNRIQGTGDIYGSNVDAYGDGLIKPQVITTLKAGKKYYIRAEIPMYIRSILHHNVTGNTNDNRKTKSGTLNISMSLLAGSAPPIKLYYQEGQGNDTIILNSSTVVPNHPKRYNDADSKGENFYYQRRGEADVDEYKVNNPSTYTMVGFDEITVNYDTPLYLVINVFGNTNFNHEGSNRAMGIILRPLKDSFISVSEATGVGIRSGRNVEYSDIIQSTHNCMDFLLSYAKLFNLYFVKDVAKKHVRILTQNSYFGNQDRRDWTYKVVDDDIDKTDYAPFGYKVGVLKWQDLGTKYEEEYLARYNKEYGSVRFDTNYQFNDDEKNLLEGNIFGNCILTTEINQYYLGRTDIIYKDDKVLPYFQDAARNRIDIDFVLAFRGDPRMTTGSNNFIITDDTALMYDIGYCWTYSGYFPLFRYPGAYRTINKGGESYSLNFGTPEIAFGEDISDPNTTEAQSGTLYDRFWRAFIRDRYSKEMRLRTCNVNLTLTDMQEDLFNKFIFIDNVPYVLNRIISYDPTNHTPTKVELITVQDINAYVGQNYIAGNMQLRRNGVYIYDSRGEVDGLAPSTNPVVVRIDSASQTVAVQITLSPASLRWSIQGADPALTVSPASGISGATINIAVPANETGNATSYFVPIRWGNTTTIIQIYQVSNWTVSANSNIGTATVNGSSTAITVADGNTVTFETTGESGYTFAYWSVEDANGNNLYYDQSLTLSISSNTTASAVWVDSSLFGWETPEFNLTDEGGQVVNFLNNPGGINYVITSSDPDIIINPTNGFLAQNISFTVPENDEGSRTFIITATYSNGQKSTFTINQAKPFIPELSIDPASMEVGANITQYNIALTCNTTWQCIIDPIYDGLVNVSPLFGEGDTTVRVTTGVNPNGVNRVGIAEFRTTYGENDLIANHTVFQRPLQGKLYVTIKNNSNQVIEPIADIVGQVMQGTTVVDQFTIASIQTDSTTYEFDLNEGNYTVSLSSYEGPNGTYSFLPASNQEVDVIGGQTAEITYEVSQTETF